MHGAARRRCHGERERRERVILPYLLWFVARRVMTVARAELGSIVDSGNDLGCFRDARLHIFQVE